jgi:hypothetical protein
LAGRTQRTLEKEQAILAALELHPSKSRACRSARIPRRTFYDWLADDPAFRARVEAAQEMGIDAVEDTLFVEAINHNITAIIFALKTWRSEKYGDRHAVDMSVHGALVVSIGERADGPA